MDDNTKDIPMNILVKLAKAKWEGTQVETRLEKTKLTNKMYSVSLWYKERKLGPGIINNSAREIYEDYQEWAKENKVYVIPTIQQFGTVLRKLAPCKTLFGKRFYCLNQLLSKDRTPAYEIHEQKKKKEYKKYYENKKLRKKETKKES